MPTPPKVLQFELLKGDWVDRWRFIYQLWGLWAGVELDREGDLARLDAELPGAGGLPASARQFLAFLNAGRLGGVAEVFTFRDVLVLGGVPGHAARSLVMQGEEDYHWAVLDSDLSKADPPLQGYHLDYDSGEPCPFVHAGFVADSVSAGAMEYCLAYTCARGGMAVCPREAPGVTPEALAEELGPAVLWDGLTMYYGGGVFVATCDRPGGFHVGSYVIQVCEGVGGRGLPPVIRKAIDGATGISERLARLRRG